MSDIATPQNGKEGQFVIPYPPNEIFKYRQPISAPFRQVMEYSGQRSSWIFDHVEYPETGGIQLYTKKCLYPQWGWVFPEALFAVNIAKRFTRELFKVFADRAILLPAIGFLLLRKKTKIKLIRNFLIFYVASTMQAQSGYVLEEIRYTPLCRELRKFIVNLFEAWGFKEEHRDILRSYGSSKAMIKLADAFAESLITQIEYDNAYRWRIEDIFAESSKELLAKNPSKEIERLIKIYISRESGGATNAAAQSFLRAGKIMKFLFWIPSIKKAFKEAVNKSEFKNLQTDPADHYHQLLYDDYNYNGKPIRERIHEFRRAHGVSFEYETEADCTPEQFEEVKAKMPPRLFYE